jgi:DNA-binding CsgD family transcriptional regulator
MPEVSIYQQGDNHPRHSPACPDLNTMSCLFGLTRKEALSNYGCLAAALFAYIPPYILFSKQSQEILHCALDGQTDEQMAAHLDISLSAVQKRWMAVYDRVDKRSPELLYHEGMEKPIRGAEKRRHLLNYLRVHPEELRPINRKLIEEQCANLTHAVK